MLRLEASHSDVQSSHEQTLHVLSPKLVNKQIVITPTRTKFNKTTLNYSKNMFEMFTPRNEYKCSMQRSSIWDAGRTDWKGIIINHNSYQNRNLSTALHLCYKLAIVTKQSVTWTTITETRGSQVMLKNLLTNSWLSLVKALSIFVFIRSRKWLSWSRLYLQACQKRYNMHKRK